jgi:hypothetical protein
MIRPNADNDSKIFLKLLEGLFREFPSLQWFRYKGGPTRLSWTADHLAYLTSQVGSVEVYFLTTDTEGPVLHCGRDVVGKLWMFASNVNIQSDDVLVSVKKTDHFMVAVFNTMIFQAGLWPLAPSKLLAASVAISNCETPAERVVNWLLSNMNNMPEQLIDACERAQLHRY